MARAVDDRLTLTAESDGPLAVDGFGASDIRVFDLGHPERPASSPPRASGRVRSGRAVSFDAQQGRRYLVLARAAIGRAAPPADDRHRPPVLPGPRRLSGRRLSGAAGRSAGAGRLPRGQGAGQPRASRTDEIYDSFRLGDVDPRGPARLPAVCHREAGAFASWCWPVPGPSTIATSASGWSPRSRPCMTSTPSGLFACDSCPVDFDGDGAPTCRSAASRLRPRPA